MSDVEGYLAGRERVLGGRVGISTRDPEAAATALLEEGGPGFCLELIEQLLGLVADIGPR